MQAADVQNVVERTGQGGQVEDASEKKFDRYSAPGRFGTSGVPVRLRLVSEVR